MHWPLKFPSQLHPILDLNCLKIIPFTAAHAHIPVGLKRGPKKGLAGCGTFHGGIQDENILVGTEFTRFYRNFAG